MSASNYSIERTVTITELAYCSGCSRAAIAALLEHDLLEPVQSDPEPRFTVEAVERVRRIRRVVVELVVGYPAWGLVVDLVVRVERLERRLREIGP